MADGRNEESMSAIRDRAMLVPPRRIRKGTSSCWECKRRKIRCIFPSSGNATCNGCQRRRMPCVSQDMPEALSPANKGNRHLSERITRVEEAVNTLAAGRGIHAPVQTVGRLRQDRRPLDAVVSGLYAHSSAPTVRALPTPSRSHGKCTSCSLFRSTDLPAVFDHGRTGTTTHHPLRAAFPAASDMEIILEESARSSRYTSLINLQPHSKLTLETLNAPHPASGIPSRDAPPITLARCMLMLAISVQAPCEEYSAGLSEPPSVLGRKLVMSATAYLLHQDNIQNTVDDLVCIILEAVFETNCGNLRRAWATYRRAMTMAQMMGLHRSPIPPLKRVDSTLEADPEFMWFRIVYMDKYLSLLLGLPQGTLDKGRGAISIPQREPSLGQFERQLMIIASSILERNENAGDTATTRSIDKELLSISQSMQTTFWRPASFHNLTPGSPENVLETVRLSAQVYYYGLLIQLHLPFMMQRASYNTEHDYSKIACVNASREIITRFVAHRSFNPKSSCSRPVDFFTLLAAMTLLLAHLDAHRCRGATNLLAHQRLSDRAILDQALERMDAVSDVGEDIMLEKSAVLVRRLLDIEAEAAKGSGYTTSVAREDTDTQEDAEKGGGELRLNIPSFGIVRIDRQGPTVSRGESVPQVELWQESMLPSPCGAIACPPSTSSFSPTGMPEFDESWGTDDWTFQGVDAAFFDSLTREIS